MKNKINYLAIIVFYAIAILCRYLTNKAGILDGIGNEYLKSILTGIGPTLGAVAVFFIFKIKPTMSIKGNYKNLTSPIYGLLEEIGWRGFLYQQLKELPLFTNILIVATLWFLWHLNFELTSSNLLFYGILILGSWGIGKVTDATNSLIAVSAFHSLNNFFPNLDNTKILILALLLTAWIIALVIRKRMQKNIG